MAHLRTAEVIGQVLVRILCDTSLDMASHKDDVRQLHRANKQGVTNTVGTQSRTSYLFHVDREAVNPAKQAVCHFLEYLQFRMEYSQWLTTLGSRMELFSMPHAKFRSLSSSGRNK